MYKYLFTPKNINQLEIKNRIVMLAMHTAYSVNGQVSDRDVEFYRARAKGGAGLIVMPVAISRRGQLEHMALLDADENISGITLVADAIHQGGSKFFVQVFHCGRNGNRMTLGGLEPYAPSAIPSPFYKEKPIEMNKEQIQEVIGHFASAAARAKKAGADGVEISATVGYIIAQFTSPITNQRTDEYGGSEENRFRFPIEVVRAVRKAVGKDYPMGIRISGAQMMKGGYDIPCMQRFCARLDAEHLVDYVNVTGGWHESPIPLITYHVPVGGYASFADAIKRVVTVPVMMSNRNNSGEVAEKLLKKGMVDFVGVARSFLADPNFVNRIEKGEPFNICQGCNRGCIEAVFAQRPVECAFNPETGMEYIEVQQPRKETGEKVLVIGGGVAGMEAAIKASERGYKVTLVTNEEKLGGQANLASLVPGKQDIARFVDYMASRIENLGIKVLLHTEVDAGFIAACKPCRVVVATGSTPRTISLPGIERAIYAKDVLTADGDKLANLRRGSTVIVGGNATGLDVAHYLSDAGFISPEARHFIDKNVPESMGTMYVHTDITIIEIAHKLGSNLGSLRRLVLADIERNGVKMLADTALKEIGDGFVLVDTPDGEKRIPADHVVMAIGVNPVVPSFFEDMDKAGISYVILGDAEKPADIMLALKSAYKWSLTL